MKANVERLNTMIDELINLNNLSLKNPSSHLDKEILLNTLKTVTLPHVLSRKFIDAEHHYLKEKLEETTIVDVETISDKLLDGIYIYRGDITTLKADAIVNAANEKLLGCFIPGHHCIDNAIHMKAGLELRMACRQMMDKQGHDEAIGRAKVTGGYNLPSKYVVHTVGPDLNAQETNDLTDIKKQLEACYLSVLEAVNEMDDVKTLVFCSISTGVYGVPIKIASEVALKTISDYLKEKNHHLEKVVIDVFSEEDYDDYKKRAQIISKS